MRLVENRNGLMIVEHRVGYSFVFRVGEISDADIKLVDRHWEGSGTAPDACHFEQEARLFAAESFKPPVHGVGLDAGHRLSQ